MACFGGGPGMPSKLYHYTDNQGRCQIEASGRINMSTGCGNKPDAAYGNGIYLTAVPPSWSTRDILGNNWDGNRVHKERAEWFFEFDLGILGSQFFNNLQKVGDGSGRDIWVYRCQTIPLPHGLRAQRRNIHN